MSLTTYRPLGGPRGILRRIGLGVENPPEINCLAPAPLLHYLPSPGPTKIQVQREVLPRDYVGTWLVNDCHECDTDARE